MRKNVVYSFLFLVLIFLRSGFSFADEQLHLKVNFQDLDSRSDLNGRTVEIRGFIYKRENGEFVLARDLGLKSCCVESPISRGAKILLGKDYNPPNTSLAVTLKGTLKKKLSNQSNGVAVADYWLEDASISQKQEEAHLKKGIFLFFGISLFSFTALLLFRKKLFALFGVETISQ